VTLAVYVLDVPEFQPVVRTAQAAGMNVRKTGDYLELTSAEDEVVLRREGSAIRTAVWHAALTGGVDARIVSFTSETLQLAKEEE
jgi:hypothetical protein